MLFVPFVPFAPFADMRLALVHDWLNQRGGAEDVLETLVETFPGAPVYTSIYWRDGMPPAYRSWDIRTTWMNRLPGIYRHTSPTCPSTRWPSPAWTSPGTTSS